MKKRIFFFTMISVALTSVMVFAAGKSYPSCKPEDYFPKKGEDFCPQLEGVTLPYCCPQPSLPALNCTYYKSKTVYSAQVRRGCSNVSAALVVNQIACVDSVQQDLVSTRLVFRGSSNGSGSCCAQTCPPTRVLNGETLSLQTAQAPASCDSLSGYSSTEQAAKEVACKDESDPTACLGYTSVCLAPPVIPSSQPDPTTEGSPSVPGSVPPTDPVGSTPVVTDPSPTTPTPPPVITPPPEVKHSRDSY